MHMKAVLARLNDRIRICIPGDPMARNAVCTHKKIAVGIEPSFENKLGCLLRLKAPVTDAAQPIQLSGRIKLVSSVQIINVESGIRFGFYPDMHCFTKLKVGIHEPW